MSLRGLALVPLIAVVVAACGSTTRIPDPPTMPIDDDAIVPYSRIGKVALGIDEATLLKWMGVPKESHGDAHFYQRGGKHPDIVQTSGGRVNRIATGSPRFVTADGIRVGSSVLEMRAAWGEPTKSLDLHEIDRFEYCFRNGLQASVDTTRSVIAAIEVTGRCNLGTR